MVQNHSCGGRRFQLHLKYGEGDLAPWHSLHRQQVCANTVRLVAHNKKNQKTQNISSWHAAFWRPLPSQSQHLILHWQCSRNGMMSCRDWVGNVAIKGFPCVTSRPANTYSESTCEREAQHPGLSQPAAHTRGRGCDSPRPCGSQQLWESPRLVQGASHPSGTTAGFASELVGSLASWPTSKLLPRGCILQEFPWQGLVVASVPPCVLSWQRTTPPGCSLSLSPMQFWICTPSSSFLVKNREWLWASLDLPHLIWQMSLWGRSGKQASGSHHLLWKVWLWWKTLRVMSSSCWISIVSLRNPVDNKQCSRHFPLEIKEGDKQEGCNSLK